ncbi:hypothetical protein CLOSTASPAR_05432 [[Clostridium] asparagiforme DSM 15981]|jgi:hypothetical protein|uniref:Uncharacterized protein n=1 Tax=[Clostridium] asparagiforme DSM 15981 TaxID=518636 RepID=C0D833_9FIRM|nr:hypothetical protein CLOSTASPAR_05432 [[Clostridium] asparagiforme DSM 15981]
MVDHSHHSFFEAAAKGGETGGKVCGLQVRAAAFLVWVIRFLKYNTFYPVNLAAWWDNIVQYNHRGGGYDRYRVLS